MVELRKRKAHSDTAPSLVKKANSVKSGSSSNDAAAAYDSALPRKVVPGSNIALAGFGGEIETQEGTKTNLETLGADFPPLHLHLLLNLETISCCIVMNN